MSLKTRIEALEKRLAKPEQAQTVVPVKIIGVHSREEVEQLRALGLIELHPEPNRKPPRGPIRHVFEEVTAAEILKSASGTSEP